MARPKTSIHRRKVRQQKHRQKRISRVLTIGFSIVILVLIVVSLPFSTADPLSDERLLADPSTGAVDAPVSIVEYGDFGCPSCRAWHQAGIKDQLLAEYGDKIQFVWRDFPVITAQSPKAAEAGQCAFDQGKFWEFHDYMYEQAISLKKSDLKSYAQDLGLDSELFNQCLDSGKNKEKVDQNLDLAFKAGFRGTPSFTVNGQGLVGPPSYDVLKNIIEQILSEQ